MSQTVCLRIKKVYFDAILSGQKTVEWRNGNAFYKRLLANNPTILKLHYQKPPKLLVEIKKISLVRKPTEFGNSKMLTTARVYRIELGKVLEATV